MSSATKINNAFEFVAVAGARARQLMEGCVPRVSGSDRPVRLAQIEVAQGEVRRLNEEEDVETGA